MPRFTISAFAILAIFTVISCGSDDSADSNACDPNPCTEENKTVCASSDEENFTCSCDEGYFSPGYGRCVKNSVAEKLPQKLEFDYEREDLETPISEEEIKEFSTEIAIFLNKINYFDWIYRVSHGVDKSTGKPDYLLFWSDVNMVKKGDTVTMLHKEKKNHGGHNQHTPNANLLSALISGYLFTENSRLEMLSEQFCKGISSTMKGMKYDKDDENDHLMTRNVITFNHEFTTDEGYKKAVDYSNWFYPYTNWNTARFKYENNPYWGEVWVTNLRSKDDLGRVFRTLVPIQYAMTFAANEEVRDACQETYEYLVRFAADIVDSNYWIRTKNNYGEIFMPGLDKNQDPGYNPKDCSSLTMYDMLVEEGAECLIKRAVTLAAYDEDNSNKCGKASWNVYEDLAIKNNPPNARIIRANHLAHIAQSLVKRDNEKALESLQGLAERFERQKVQSLEEIRVNKDAWDRDIALNMMHASAYGYPLTSADVRQIHKYYKRSLAEYENWNQWNLWDSSIPDGTYDINPPNSKTTATDEREYWIRARNLANFLEYCWSPFKNPKGIAPVDCEIVKGILTSK